MAMRIYKTLEMLEVMEDIEGLTMVCRETEGLLEKVDGVISWVNGRTHKPVVINEKFMAYTWKEFGFLEEPLKVDFMTAFEEYRKGGIILSVNGTSKGRYRGGSEHLLDFHENDIAADWYIEKMGED